MAIDNKKTIQTPSPTAQEQAGGGVTFKDPTPDITPQPFVTPEPTESALVGAPSRGEQTERNLSPEFATVFQSPNEGRNRDLETTNLQKLRSSGEIQAGTNAAAVQAKINMATYGIENPVFGAVDSAGAAEDLVADQMKEVGGGLADIEEKRKLPEYQLYQDFTGDIQDARDVAFDLYERTKANIEQDFQIRESEQRDENRITTGAQSKALARMGAFGASGSALNYMQGVDRKNQEKINKLLVQKETLLIAATKAQADGDFALLDRLIKESHDVTDQFNQVEKWKFEDAMKDEDQIMKQTRFGWDEEGRAMEKISSMYTGFESWNDVPMGERITLASEAGVSVTTMEAVFNQNKKGVGIAEDKATFDILSKIPVGQTVEINGRYYTGIETAGTNNQYLVTDDKTQTQSLVTVNSAGKEVGRVKLANKFTNQPGSYDEKTLTKIGSKIGSAFADGAYGGWCGEFIHNVISDYPGGLNTLEQKKNQISPNIGFGDNQTPPQIGDVVVQNYKAEYVDDDGVTQNAGHVAIISAYDAETGLLTLTESNFSNDKKVSNSRTINVQDASVEGYFRGNIRPEFTGGGSTPPEVDLEPEGTDTLFTDIDDELSAMIEEGADLEDFKIKHDVLYTRHKDVLDQIIAQRDPEGKIYGGDSRLLLDQMLQKEKFTE